MVVVLPAVIGGIVGVVTLWQLVLRWGAHRVDEVRSALVDVRTFLQDVVARGGVSSKAYLTDEARTLGERLEDLSAEVHDKELRQDCIAVARAFNSGWANAPPAARVVNLANPVQDATRSAQLQHQTDAARAGLEAIAVAMARVNRLTHWVILR